MRWVKENNKTELLHEYRLLEEEKCRLVVKYNHSQHSARISCDGHYSLFFIEKHHSLHAKTIFKNEYGLEIGKIDQERWHSNKGVIEIQDSKYYYSYRNTPLAELVIYDEDGITELVTCGLNVEQNNAPSAIMTKNTEQQIENSCFLLGLCWYLFLPVAKENIPAFAD